MLARCDPTKPQHTNSPTYSECVIHPDFLDFQKFAAWCQKQIGFGVKGYALDKDIVIHGNKVYGPDTCVFVPQALNNLILSKRSDASIHPGVTSTKYGRYKVTATRGGKHSYIATFDNVDDAIKCYISLKTSEIKRIAVLHRGLVDDRVIDKLLGYKYGE